MVDIIGTTFDIRDFIEAGCCTFQEAVDRYGYGIASKITDQFECGELVAILHERELLFPTWQFSEFGTPKRSIVYVFRLFRQEGTTSRQVIEWFFIKNKHLKNCRPVDLINDTSSRSKLLNAAMKACSI